MSGFMMWIDLWNATFTISLDTLFSVGHITTFLTREAICLISFVAGHDGKGRGGILVRHRHRHRQDAAGGLGLG